MNSENTKSSATLQKEVRNELHRVERDLDRIETRLSPGALIDDAIFSGRRRNIGSTFNHLKNNPIGTTFLALGTLLLMEDDLHQSYESVARNKTGLAIDKSKRKIDEVSHVVRDKFSQKSDSIDDGVSKVRMAKTKLNSARESLQESVHGVKESLKARTQEGIHSAKEAFNSDSHEERFEFDIDGRNDIRTKISKVGQDLKSRTQNGMQQGRGFVSNLDPTTYMALGAGLGALTGAIVPVSSKEEAFIDDKMGDNISSFTSDLQSALNESAGILKNEFMSDIKEFNFNFF